MSVSNYDPGRRLRRERKIVDMPFRVFRVSGSQPSLFSTQFWGHFVFIQIMFCFNLFFFMLKLSRNDKNIGMDIIPNHAFGCVCVRVGAVNK